MAVGQTTDFILPVNDVLGGDFRELSFAEIGENLLLDDTLLSEPCVKLQLGLNVLFVQRYEALKGHVDVGLLLHQELPFPCLCFLLGGKATLELLLPLALPVGVAELHIPSAVFLVLKCRHNQIPFLSKLSLVP